ncbi:ATP-binding cassette domain-containing protein [Thiomicrospira sp. WB1]|jgi:zinc transport system ATP-binding protein|uniref:ATP-binding cassette domain-containing protein n=1 Tax=Thiomicrospira sp. WB1 TaxID=1685380 RepID=UPI00074623FA|nr:ATP-binding cassette domain-containing protein [Thiomicrospira sp. WB1]KUJ71394.1 zinc ABC transporter ATP-binding protein [Thiomicrospira sp. WB1]
MNTTPLIEAHNISHRFDDQDVLSNVSLSLYPDEILTLIGPNGAGKSTLLKLLLGLMQPTQGRIQRKPGLRVGFMPQKIQIDDSLPLSVTRFLSLARPRHEKRSEFITKLEAVAEELTLGGLMKRPVQKISGGEMQRVLLARALLKSPDLLVLDEPVQGVDLQGQTELYEYINAVRLRHHCGILMVSHDLHIVMKDTHRVLCLNQHICCQGHPQTISGTDAFKTLFGDGFEQLALYEHHHSEACEHVHPTQESTSS